MKGKMDAQTVSPMDARPAYFPGIHSGGRHEEQPFRLLLWIRLLSNILVCQWQSEQASV